MKLHFALVALFLISFFALSAFHALSYFQETPESSVATTTSPSPIPYPTAFPIITYDPMLGELTSNHDLTDELYNFNKRLNKVHRDELYITLKDGSSYTDIALPPSVIRSILIPPVNNLDGGELAINSDTLIAYLKPLLTPKQLEYFSPDSVYQNTLLALNSRFNKNSTPIVLGVDDGPTSRGELAGRYLEIDLSQQKMYFFIDQKLFKEYKISTGEEYPTPLGDYTILNKAPLAFSDIYNVWMPYWMGFKYAGDVGAYLGLHEIAYTNKIKGKPVYSHGYYIGDKGTGGCVAMEPKDSKEIYELSPVGMYVRIVP